jgi:phage terminase large subunit-like protein
LRRAEPLHSRPKLDPFSEKAIKQANPAAGDFLNMKEVRKQAANAKALPSQESLYRNYTLNQRVDRNTPFIAKTIWQANGGEVSEWGDTPVYAGLDLSSTADLTAFVPIAWVDDAWETKPTFWLPEGGLAEKSRADRVPYDLWETQKASSRPRQASQSSTSLLLIGCSIFASRTTSRR